MNVKVNDTVCIKKINNSARCRTDSELLNNAVVTDVKRKWFKVSDPSHTRFDISTGMSDGQDYCSEYCAYESRTEVEEELESMFKCRRIANAFQYGNNVENLSLEEIRCLYNLIYKKV